MYVRNVSEQECDNILVRDSTGQSEFIGQKPPEMWLIFSIFSRITVLPSKEIKGKKKTNSRYSRQNHFLFGIQDSTFCGYSDGKESAFSAGDWGLIPVSGRSSGRRKWKPTSSILGWRILWTQEPGGLESMGLQAVRHD